MGTETLTEKQGVMQGVGRDGKLSNKPGQCAEPHCANSSGRNSSPITGSITIWRGEPEDLKQSIQATLKQNLAMTKWTLILLVHYHTISKFITKRQSKAKTR